MISSTEKARENRIRRFARIERFELVKSRRRDPRAWDYNRWWLTVLGPDGTAVRVIGGRAVGDPPGLDLGEVESLLYGADGDDR